MCARRFLIAVFILTLIVVAAGFAIFQYGQGILIRSATPVGHFSPPPPSSGPNYSLADSWLARPDFEASANPALWRPANYSPPTLEPRQAAAFFIHPTTYLQRDRWNAALSGNGESDSRALLFVRSQASAFNSVADIWAPRYRQAAYGAFLLRSEDADQALDLAFSDVRKAFEAFLEGSDADRPIILAAHSQGSLHLLRLLEEYGPRLKDRLIAAYVVGWPVSTAVDLPPSGLSACETAVQTGCVLSWQSFADPANPSLVLDSWSGTKGPGGGKRTRSDMLCVNPLSGVRNGAAPAQSNPGTLVPTGDLTSASLEPGRVAARCDDGFLIIDGNIPALGPYVLPGNNYHVYDYALFWAAVRRDAERRTEAWQRR